MPDKAQETVRHILEFPRETPNGVKDWIPVIQSLVWPVILLLIVLLYRRHLYTILYHIAERVRLGDPWKVGPVEMGGTQRKLDPAERPKQLAAEGEDVVAPSTLPNTIYLSHQAARDPSLDRAGNEYYRLRIYVDADAPDLLDQVERVVYHLHPSFKEPKRTVTDRGNNFEIQTLAWGEFNMTADIFIRGRSSPLMVERYINLPS